MRTVIASSMVGLLVAVFVGIGQSVAEPRSTELEGSLLRSYSSVKELTKAAEVIVVGEVTATTPRPRVNLPFSLATIEVSQVLKGSVVERVRVLQTGGVFPLSKRSSPVAEGVFGQRVARVGERYILFLYRYIGPVAADAYMPLGEFQGRFLVNGGTIGFGGAAEHLTRPQFGVLRSVQGRTEADVVSEIRSAQ